jgi:transcriptional regulator with XRE-family HTH domain
VENPLVGALAARLKAWRAENGLALKRVAAKLDVSVSIICEWEHAHRFPSVDHLWALAQYTGIPAWEFIQPVKGVAQKKKRPPAPRNRR